MPSASSAPSRYHTSVSSAHFVSGQGGDGFADRALVNCNGPLAQVRRVGLRRRLLGLLLSSAAYEAARAARLAQPVVQRFVVEENTGTILGLVADIPTLLAEAAPEHRRAIMRQLISEAWLRRRRVIALRPTRLAAALATAARGNAAVNDCVITWAGWDSNPRPWA